MANTALGLGGRFTFSDAGISVNRFGFGAMQLAGPQVFGPPRDPPAAMNVLREALRLGIDHIDTSDFYGPHVTNQLIRAALHPYKESLVIVTKVGYRRSADGGWHPARSKLDIEGAVHDNLRNLGLSALDVVNLRLPAGATLEDEELGEPLNVLENMKRQGLIRNIGLSNVKQHHLLAAERITPIVCVQNQYNLAYREDDAFIEYLGTRGIAYVPFFPLGGFSPLQSSVLRSAASELEITPIQLALAWLLHRAPNILLIPGTSSLEHLRQNVVAGAVDIPPEILARLDAIAHSSRRSW